MLKVHQARNRQIRQCRAKTENGTHEPECTHVRKHKRPNVCLTIFKDTLEGHSGATFPTTPMFQDGNPITAPQHPGKHTSIQNSKVGVRPHHQAAPSFLITWKPNHSPHIPSWKSQPLVQGGTPITAPNWLLGRLPTLSFLPDFLWLVCWLVWPAWLVGCLASRKTHTVMLLFGALSWLVGWFACVIQRLMDMQFVLLACLVGWLVGWMDGWLLGLLLACCLMGGWMDALQIQWREGVWGRGCALPRNANQVATALGKTQPCK